MKINVATQKLENAISSYSTCQYSIEELLAETGLDDIVDYFGAEVFFTANQIRAEKDVVFGTLVYNYGRDGYDLIFDCRADEKSCKRVRLREDDGFDVWFNGEWLSTRLAINPISKHWYLCDDYKGTLEDSAIENMRIRTCYKYYSKFDIDVIDEEQTLEEYIDESRKAVEEYSKWRRKRKKRKTINSKG